MAPEHSAPSALRRPPRTLIGRPLGAPAHPALASTATTHKPSRLVHHSLLFALEAQVSGRPGRGSRSGGAATPPPSPFSRFLRLAPVATLPGKDGGAAHGLRGPIEHICHATPHGIVRHGPMGLEGGLVLVDLIEVVDVRLLRVLQDIEAEAARLVTLGAERIHLDGLEKALPLPWLDVHLHPDRQHARLLALRVRLAQTLRVAQRATSASRLSARVPTGTPPGTVQNTSNSIPSGSLA